MPQPDRERKRSDRDFETLSKVEIDGDFTVPTNPTEGAGEEAPAVGGDTAQFPGFDPNAADPAGDPAADVEPTITGGSGAAHTQPSAGTSRARAVKPSGSTSSDAAAGPGDAAPGTVLGGRFEILHPLGKGGMGEVFLVRDRQIEMREVALKLVLPRWSKDAAFRSLFFKEIRAAQGFVSEHAVQVRDCGQLPDERLFLTMDFVEGESLTQLLRREKTLMPRHALEIARQILLALSSGHEKAFIHRDVKPSNVMLASRVPKTSENPHGVKVGLLDFGIAGLTEEMEAGRGPGTPHYMSPEQAAGEKLDQRSDLFAVGVMLFEMISGSKPFAGRTQQEITASVIDTDPTPLVNNLTGIKKPIKKILRKALQKKREKRFSSAADFIAAIEKCESFVEADGAPAWVGAAAAVFALSTAGLSWMVVDQRIGKGEDRAAIESEVRAQIMASDVVPLNNRNEELVLARQTMQGTIDRLTAEKSTAESRIVVLEDKLQGAESKAKTAKSDALSVDVASLKERSKNQVVIDYLNAHVDDLIEISATTLDSHGAKLAPIGERFDRLALKLGAESVTGETRIMSSAVRQRGIDDRTPGLEYLEGVEALANDVHRFESRRVEDQQSFVALADLGARLADLSSESAVEEFVAQTGALTSGGASEGRWLALRRLKDSDELKTKLVEAAERAVGGSAFGTGSAPEADEDVDVESAAVEGLSKEEQDAAVKEGQREVSLYPAVQKKKDLLEWIRQFGNESAAEALYGAQVSDETQEQRLAALRTVFRSLEVRLERQQVRLAEAASTRVRTIADRDDLAAQTAELVGFLRSFGDTANDQIAPLIEAHVAELGAALVEDGRMTSEGLRERLPAEVDDLAAILAERTAVADAIDDGALAELDWMVAARRWYMSPWSTTSGSGADRDGWFAAFAARERVAPLSTYGDEWKRLLAFQYQLREHSDLAKPDQGPRLFASFPSGSSGGKQEEWMRLRVVDRGEGLELERTYFDIEGNRDGSPKREPFVPTGSSDAIQWRKKQLLRLRALPEEVTFVAWNPARTKARAAFESASDKSFGDMNRNVTPSSVVHDQYRGSAGIDESALVCLEVQGSSGSKYLVHPILGVVRHESARYDYELVHLER
ncbi:MAG: serine/threonine-protein kinase [Planctomycetota bacterium]